MTTSRSNSERSLNSPVIDVVTTNLWNSDQDYDHALQGFDASLAMLGWITPACSG